MLANTSSHQSNSSIKLINQILQVIYNQSTVSTERILSDRRISDLPGLKMQTNQKRRLPMRQRLQGKLPLNMELMTIAVTARKDI